MKRSAFYAAMAMACVISMSVVAAPTSQPADALVAPVSTEDQNVENLLHHRLPNVQLPGVSLSDSIDFIRDITGANIYVDWKAIELAGVTKNTLVDVSETKIPMREAFKKILAATGADSLEFHVIDGMILVSTKLNFADRKVQRGPYLAELSDAMHAAATLDRRMASVQLPTVPFRDAIDFLRDISGVSIFVKWNVLAAAGIDKTTPVSLKLQDAKLKTIFYILLDQAGDGKLGYVTEPTQIMTFDRKLQKRVPKETELITISTIDDLVASKGNATTQPS